MKGGGPYVFPLLYPHLLSPLISSDFPLALALKIIIK